MDSEEDVERVKVGWRDELRGGHEERGYGPKGESEEGKESPRAEEAETGTRE